MGPIHLSGLNRYALKDRKAVRTDVRTDVPEAAEVATAINIAQIKGKLGSEVV